MAQTSDGSPNTSPELQPGAASQPADGTTGASPPVVPLDDVAERPVLASGVQLVGELQGAGFQDRQWLIQRDDQFMQVTELLYRLLEHLDGGHTVAEVAAGLSAAIGRRVQPDQVRHLIARKLIPMGLVARADGSVLTPSAAAARMSPLAVTLRRTLVSPRLIEPVARVLQVLYLPPVLLALLLAVAAAHGWLYLVHGVGSSLYAAFYEPGRLLLLAPIMIAAALVHEFGHATALHYGGGRVRGIGLGFYFMYPVFYADVTDAYRLSRWARVRTDLGGFYFHLLFALGVMALYAVTGAEWLLLAVILIDLEIIEQSLPVGRFDGYWALADLTGIPDFFSQLGPFLRSVLPLPWWRGSQLPPLRPWVKAVFAGYILVIVPVLAVLMVVMVQGAPRVLATAADSLRSQGSTFATAYATGDLLSMAASGVQIGTLGLMVIGVVVALVNLGRWLLGELWRWSQPTPARRLAGALSTVGATAAVALLWLPYLPTAEAPLSPAATAVAANFVPIAPNERGTIPDVLSGQVAIRMPPATQGVAPASADAAPPPPPPAATLTPRSTTSVPTAPTPPAALPPPGAAAVPPSRSVTEVEVIEEDCLVP